LNEPNYFGFEQVVLGYAHQKYVIIFVIFFPHSPKKVLEFVNLAKTLENKKFKVVTQDQNMLDIHV
jgi:hypothetical protein